MYEVTQTLPEVSGVSFLKAHFDTSPLGVFMFDEAGSIRYVNHTAAGIIGFSSPEEADGYSLADVESYVNCGLGEAMERVRRGQIYQKYEHRCTNRLGHFAILNIYCSPYRNSRGEITGVLGMVQDITDMSRRNEELKEAIFELSIMAQVSEALSSTADLDEVLKIILTGCTANQGLGFNRAFLFLTDEHGNILEGKLAVGPSSPEEAGQIWSRLAQQQRTLKELLDDYSERENNSNYSLTSRIAGWRIPLHEENFFSRAINESCGRNVNSAENLTPGSMEIMNRLNTGQLAVAPIISKGKTLGLIAADNQITGRRVSSSEVALLQTFANHTAVAIERSRLYDRAIEHAAELEEINRRLAESQEQIIRVEKMSVIGELTSSIAHELRNPLTVIGGFANLMLSAGGNEANAEYLNIILSETKRAETVLHHVLDFSRASRTKTREIDFNILVANAADLLLSKIGHRYQAPHLKPAAEKMAVWGNPDQLLHALVQFLMISVEETTDDCAVELVTGKNGANVRLTIGFNGGEEARAKVTRTLKQIFGNSTGTQKLSIIVAGETLRYHGGNYGVESSAENLPKLFIELPQYKGGFDD